MRKQLFVMRIQFESRRRLRYANYQLSMSLNYLCYVNLLINNPVLHIKQIQDCMLPRYHIIYVCVKKVGNGMDGPNSDSNHHWHTETSREIGQFRSIVCTSSSTATRIFDLFVWGQSSDVLSDLEIVNYKGGGSTTITTAINGRRPLFDFLEQEVQQMDNYLRLIGNRIIITTVCIRLPR